MAKLIKIFPPKISKANPKSGARIAAHDQRTWRQINKGGRQLDDLVLLFAWDALADFEG